MSEKALILDNGAYTAKIGYSKDNKPKIIPNCIMKAKSERRRPFVGDQIDDCRDASGLFFILPFQKGYVVNWDIQKNVWDYMFSRDCVDVNFTDTNVIVTEPYFNFPSIQEAMTEIFFEEYECETLLRINAGSLSCYKYTKSNPNVMGCLVIDCGYSFTHIVPYVQGKKVKSAIIRIDVGGKLLTNHLKDIISYRQLHVMDETYVMNQVKEDSCFVSQSFMKDMEVAKKKNNENTIVRDYVLPDFTTIRRGYVRPTDKVDEGEYQVLRLNNERFSVPEILFHPSDIGINQMGIPEAVKYSIEKCPPETHPHLYNNIIITGGSSLFPGFRERVETEVRMLAPDHFEVTVSIPDDPVSYAWSGGVALTSDPDFYTLTVSKKEYDEEGYTILDEKFDV